jgi:VWFA-related protein
MAAQETPSFKARRTVVLLRVYVASGNPDRPVEGLGSDVFSLLDNGKEAPARVEDLDVPVRIVAVVQCNRAAASALVRVRETGAHIAAMIGGENASTAVVSFTATPTLVQPFAEKGGDPGQAFRRILAAGTGSSLLDAVAFAVALFPRSTMPERRILVVFGESRDRDSTASFEDVRGMLLRDGIELYLMAYSTYLQPFMTRPVFECPKPGCVEEDKLRVAPEGGRGLLGELKRQLSVDAGRRLAFDTGGISVSFLSRRGLDEALGRISAAIHQGYLLSFSPAAMEGEPAGLRSISISIRRPGTFTVIHRKQYYLE